LPAPDAQASFVDYLALHRRRLPTEVRRFALTLVQGFDAADPARIGAREVIDEWRGPAAADQATYRPLAGYGALLDAMHASLPSSHVRFVLRAVVERMRWRAGAVEVQASQGDRTPLIVRARRAIVTLPLGVLQSAPGERGHVAFDPPLAAKARALSHLHSGPVHKVVLRFRRAFWTEHDDGRYRDAAFFFAPGAAFPTFWTALPWRAPQLVEWSAGPAAATLRNCTDRDMRRLAYASLALLFGRRRYDSLLEHFAWHDWQRDPFARGANSYVAPGGAQARATLGRPLDSTLYFAGEACDTTGEAATVGGALRSGERAARQVLRSASSRA
jgi:monoamine oxidase